MPNTHQIEAMLNLTAEVSRVNTKVKMYEIPRAVAKLQRIASSLHKRYEAACSYEWANTEAYEKRTERLEWKAGELAEAIGVQVEFQRDPRGWPMSIKTLGGYETRIG